MAALRAKAYLIMAWQRSSLGGGSILALILAGCATTAPPFPPAGLVADARGALQLRCGEDSFRVVFEETRAIIIDGAMETVLTRLDGSPVSTYTNGRMTFTKTGGKETPTEVSFSRGRMVPVKCYIAQT